MFKCKPSFHEYAIPSKPLSFAVSPNSNYIAYITTAPMMYDYDANVGEEIVINLFESRVSLTTPTRVLRNNIKKGCRRRHSDGEMMDISDTHLLVTWKGKLCLMCLPSLDIIFDSFDVEFETIFHVRFSYSSNHILVVMDRLITVFSFRNGEVVGDIHVPILNDDGGGGLLSWYSYGAISGDGRFIAYATHSFLKNPLHIHIFDTTTSTIVTQKINLHTLTERIENIIFSRDSKYVYWLTNREETIYVNRLTDKAFETRFCYNLPFQRGGCINCVYGESSIIRFSENFGLEIVTPPSFRSTTNNATRDEIIGYQYEKRRDTITSIRTSFDGSRVFIVHVDKHKNYLMRTLNYNSENRIRVVTLMHCLSRLHRFSFATRNLVGWFTLQTIPLK